MRGRGAGGEYVRVFALESPARQVEHGQRILAGGKLHGFAIEAVASHAQAVVHAAPRAAEQGAPEENAYRVEAAPVDLARAMPSKGVQVVRSRVTLVAIESIAGIALVQRAHLSVARRLCQNRRG